MEKKDTYFEVVRLFLDDEHEVDDSRKMGSFETYDEAYSYAKNQQIKDNEQIAIWEIDRNTYDSVDSWVVLPESEAD